MSALVLPALLRRHARGLRGMAYFKLKIFQLNTEDTPVVPLYKNAKEIMSAPDFCRRKPVNSPNFAPVYSQEEHAIR